MAGKSWLVGLAAVIALTGCSANLPEPRHEVTSSASSTPTPTAVETTDSPIIWPMDEEFAYENGVLVRMVAVNRYEDGVFGDFTAFTFELENLTEDAIELNSIPELTVDGHKIQPKLTDGMEGMASGVVLPGKIRIMNFGFDFVVPNGEEVEVVLSFEPDRFSYDTIYFEGVVRF